MGEINRALGTSGAGVMLRVGEKEYRILPPSQGVYGEFEAWLEDSIRERLRVRYLAKRMDKAEYENRLREINRDINAFVYSWGTPACNSALQSVDGGLAFVTMLMRQADPKLTQQQVKAILEECEPAYLKTVMEQVMGRTEGGDDTVPNPIAETGAA